MLPVNNTLKECELTVFTVAKRTVPNSSVSDHMSRAKMAPCSFARWSINALSKHKSQWKRFFCRPTPQKKTLVQFSTNLYDIIQIFDFKSDIFGSVTMFYQMISNHRIVWIVCRNEHENNLKMQSKNALFSLVRSKVELFHKTSDSRQQIQIRAEKLCERILYSVSPRAWQIVDCLSPILGMPTVRSLNVSCSSLPLALHCPHKM